MYQRLRAFLDAGGSLLYLGANGIYENAEYSSDQTSMIFRNGIDGGPRADALFRRLDPPMPERDLLGIATERCGVGSEIRPTDRCSVDVQAGYEVLLPDHPFFSGIASQGQLIGQVGDNVFGHPQIASGQASAWEIDTSSGPGAVGIPCDCSTDDVPVPEAACAAIANRIALLQDLLVAHENGPQTSNSPTAESTPVIEQLMLELADGRAELQSCHADQELPQNLIVLARARNWCEGGVLRDATTPADSTRQFECIGGQWRGAEMVTYTAAGGGFVFSVGSMTFGGSLLRDARLQALVRRVLDEAERRVSAARSRKR
jgi:hypothetical protein